MRKLTVSHGSRLHTAKILRLAENLPMVIEIVDEGGRIDWFLTAIEPVIGRRLVTLEKVRTVRYQG